MKGIHHVEISNRDAKFKFDLNRNITIIRGDSGTGKTTLFEMVSAQTRLKSASGVNISCDKECVALIDMDWKNQLNSTFDSIVFIDEGFRDLMTAEFAGAIKNSDNYYVIFSRDSLHNLPYSVEEIYEIKTSGKYHTFKKIYNSTKTHVYGKTDKRAIDKFDLILTEDSKSGFEFFKKYSEQIMLECETAASNSNIFKSIQNNKKKKAIIIADGAAFGSEIDRVIKLQKSGCDFRLYLPESFEWLILSSEIIKKNEIKQILDNPANYIESSEYFSWENFFESYLITITANTPFQYSKESINPVYVNGNNMGKVVQSILPN